MGNQADERRNKGCLLSLGGVSSSTLLLPSSLSSGAADTSCDHIVWYHTTVTAICSSLVNLKVDTRIVLFYLLVCLLVLLKILAFMVLSQWNDWRC